MSKIKLRHNSKGWWFVWFTFLSDTWPPIREVIVGPAETIEAAFEIGQRNRRDTIEWREQARARR